MGQGADIYDAHGKLVPGSGSLKTKAQEESPEAKKRAVVKEWNARYFRDGLKIGSGLGGAAAIEKYKVANPEWKKARDTWAQAQVKPKPAPKPGSTLGSLAGVKP